ncbi:MAG TPA: sigma-70 family RNA polymerase sigma factor, partial [Gemmataceae bacterium]
MCRRVLGDAHDADDAFQATFLALARRAGQARWGESVGGWLHEVAHRAAAKLRRGNRRRSAREARAGAAAGGGEAGGSLRELGEVLDEELRRLPERHRVPLILCYYEGRTRDEAARQLGGSLRTLERRLQEGRDLLRRRLERRGVSPGAALLAAAMPAAGAGASLPAVPAPAAAAQGLSARAVSLAGEVLRAMGALKWKAAASLILTLGAGLGGALLALQPGTPGAPPRPGDPSPAAARDADAAEPLPEGALARLGTERFRFGYSVRSVAFSPDGETLATSGNGWGACLWDARTGRLRRNLYNWNESPAVVFSPDGKMIAAPSTHWGTFLWDARTGERLRLLRGAGLCAAFSPDGKLLAVAGRDRSVQLWDPATDRQLRKFGEFSGDVRDLAFSPDGKLLATAADADGADLRLWDVATGAERHRLVGHKRSVSAVAFSPDGERLASAGTDDLAVRIWDPATGKHLHKVPTPGTHPLSLAFSPGGKRLAVGVGSGRVHLFDTGTWEKVRDWEAHEEWVTSLAFSPDGRTLATGSLMGSDVRLWDPETGEERLAGAGHPTTVLRIAVRPDGRTLVSGDLKKMLLTWDLAAGEVRGRARVPVIARGDAWTLSHDGRLAATGHGRTFLTGLGKPDEAIRIWDAGTGKELRRLGTHPSRVEGLAFSRDGRRLASAGWDN